MVVTYNPNPSFVENIAAVRVQADHVVVVDNGSSNATEAHLHELESRQGCTVIRNRQNLGIAAALNLGVKHAMDAGFDWVATFDQDSRVSDGFIATMLETYRQAPNPESVAVISPSYVDHESGVHARMQWDRNGGLLKTMTSGNMIPSAVLRRIGAFDESLFIDQVDTEFCLRARREGMLILQSPAILFHALGRTTYHRLFGYDFEVTNHSAGRRYYMTRNTLRLLRCYRSDRQWVSSECYLFITGLIAIALVEDHRWQKFRAVLSGALDALKGKTGKRFEL